MKTGIITVLVILLLLGLIIFIENRTAKAPILEEEITTEQNMQNEETNQNLEAQNGDLVAVHYTGKLTDGTIFDSSIERKDPIQFILGSGMVIKGWEEGLVGMKVGDKKTLEISPEKGYGSQPVTNPQTGELIIPANSTLIFDVKMVNITRPDGQ